MAAAQPDPEPLALVAALTYSKRGWRCVPIIPGKKHPELPAWQDVATTKEDVLRRWWHLYPNHGVGIVTGVESGIFVLDVDISGDKQGDETLADLEHEHGALPDTVEVVTGSGGRHLYFRMPAGHVIANDAGRRLGPGLDVRGEGGQVVAPPTLHPTSGRRYEWEVDHHPRTTPVADPPAWLVDLLTVEPEQPIPPPPRTDRTGDEPGADFENRTTWAQLLAADGWTYAGAATNRTTGARYEKWCRPGVTDHHGLTVNALGTDRVKVFTPSVPGLDEGGTYSRFGYYAATRHGGDHAAAAAALRANGYGRDLDLAGLIGPKLDPGGAIDVDVVAIDGVPVAAPTGWEPIDLAPILEAGWQPVRPTILQRDDGNHLLYAGCVNAFLGESGSGKSWMAQAAVAAALIAGHGAAYVDHEDHVGNVVARLLALGVPLEAIRDRFVYVHPEMAASQAAIDQLRAHCERVGAVVVVIDSVGESMGQSGLKQNDDDAVVWWFRDVARPLARTGAAVLLVDHVPKDPEASNLQPIGSQRKRAAIDGAAYRVDTVFPFGIGQDGRLRLTVAKDRHGTYPRGTIAAEVRIASSASGDHVRLTLSSPEPVAQRRDDEVEQAVLDLINAGGQWSLNGITKQVRKRKERVADACAALLDADLIDIDAVCRYVRKEADLAGMIGPEKHSSDAGGSGGSAGSGNHPRVTGSAGPRPPLKGRGPEPAPGTTWHQSNDDRSRTSGTTSTEPDEDELW
jgi:hypothetical protein